MREQLKHLGIFIIYEHQGFSTDEIKFLINDKERFNQYFRLLSTKNNTLMANQKLLMANAVYPSIDRLVLTDQTSTPADTETAPGGTTIYTTVSADEYFRSAEGNPYQVGWNIVDNAANGTWGSFCLVTSSGALINRALAGVTKTAGQGRLVLFSGSVI